MNEPTDTTDDTSEVLEDRRHPEFHSTGLLTNLNASMESYSVKDGKLKMRYEIPENMHNGAGVVHGGIITTILDQTMINALFLADLSFWFADAALCSFRVFAAAPAALV